MSPKRSCDSSEDAFPTMQGGKSTHLVQILSYAPVTLGRSLGGTLGAKLSAIREIQQSRLHYA